MRVFQYLLIAIGAGLFLSACGGSSGDSLATSAVVETDTPVSHGQLHAPVRTAFTVEELDGSAGIRAKPHHTIYKEVHHPDSALAALAVRTVPYSFERSVTKDICIDDRKAAGHMIQVTSESRGVISELRSNGSRACVTVQFDSGDYELHFTHSGAGSVDEPLHVFTRAEFRETTEDSRFGQWLASQNTAARAVRASSTSSGSSGCEKIETITLSARATGTLFDTALTTSTAAFYETGVSLVRGLNAYPKGKMNTDTTPSSRNYLDVYECSDGVRFGIPDENLFLVSKCGYFFFLASSLDDATPFQLLWDPSLKRLDLVNQESGRVVKTVARGDGRLVSNEGGELTAGFVPFFYSPARLKSISKLGLCEDYPDISGGLGRGPRRKKRSFVLSTTIYPEAGAHTPMEFSYSPLQQASPPTFNDFEERFSADPSTFEPIMALYMGTFDKNEKKAAQAKVLLRQFMNKYERTPLYENEKVPFGSSVDLEDRNGFTSSHQDTILVSVGRCESCDITGLDLSGRTFGALDLKSSQLDGVNLSGATLASLTLEGAKLTNVNLSKVKAGFADFSNATLQNVNFSDAVLALAELNSITQFSGATVSHSTFARNDFTGGNWRGATIDSTNFTDVILNGIDLQGAKLSIVTVSLSDKQQGKQKFVEAQNLNLKDASLAKVRMNSVDLTGSDFSGSTLLNSQFVGANAQNVNFARSGLTATSFSQAFLIGADFSSAQFSGSSFDSVAAYSSGTATTSFKDCVVQSGSFTNSHFMETSFANCDFQGGSFAGSLFINSPFTNARVVSDATEQVISFSAALFAGADFGGADLSGADLSNAITSAKPGHVDIVILTSPGESLERRYNYNATVRPATTGSGTTCPNLSAGPCTSDAQWQPSDPPRFKGKEDLDSW